MSRFVISIFSYADGEIKMFSGYTGQSKYDLLVDTLYALDLCPSTTLENYELDELLDIMHDSDNVIEFLEIN